MTQEDYKRSVDQFVYDLQRIVGNKLPKKDEEALRSLILKWVHFARERGFSQGVDKAEAELNYGEGFTTGFKAGVDLVNKRWESAMQAAAGDQGLRTAGVLPSEEVVFNPDSQLWQQMMEAPRGED